MSQYVFIAKTIEEAAQVVVVGIEESQRYTTTAWVTGEMDKDRYQMDEGYKKIDSVEDSQTILIFGSAEELIVIPPPGGAAFQFLKK